MDKSVTEEDNMGLIWENRLALWLPRPLLLGVFLVAVCISTTYLSYQWFFDFRVEQPAFGIALFIAWALMAPRYYLAPPARFATTPLSKRHEAEVRALHLPRDAIRASRYAGTAGVLAFFGLWELLLIFQGHTFVSGWIQLHDGSAITPLFLLLGWFSGRWSYFGFAGFWNPPGPQRSNIDLLNLEDLYTFGRSGLRGTLVLYIILAIGYLLILPGMGTGLWVVLPIFAIQLGLGLLILITPAREVRRSIRNAKCEELARLEPILRQARDDTLKGDASTQGRLTDLLAYKTQVESTREWAFKSSTFVRFGLYLLIPIASMIGGALVERVVDMVLD